MWPVKNCQFWNSQVTSSDSIKKCIEVMGWECWEETMVGTWVTCHIVVAWIILNWMSFPLALATTSLGLQWRAQALWVCPKLGCSISSPCWGNQNMGGSINGVPLKSFISMEFSRFKPSILGYPHDYGFPRIPFFNLLNGHKLCTYSPEFWRPAWIFSVLPKDQVWFYLSPDSNCRCYKWLRIPLTNQILSGVQMSPIFFWVAFTLPRMVIHQFSKFKLAAPTVWNRWLIISSGWCFIRP